MEEVVGKYIVAALRTIGKAAAQRNRLRVGSCIWVAEDVRYVIWNDGGEVFVGMFDGRDTMLDIYPSIAG